MNESVAVKRQNQHRSAVNYLKAGEFSLATDLLVDTLGKYGPHVGLLCDLAASAYLAKRIDLYLATTKELALQFGSFSSRLSDMSYMRTCMSLGKLLEESGDVVGAIRLYESAKLDRPYFEIQHINFCNKIDAQLLRLNVFIGSANIQAYYQQCLRAQESSVSLNIQVEQALVMAELSFNNTNFALVRLTQLVDKEIPLDDKRLVYFDFMEDVLIQRTVIEVAPLVEPSQDSFEKLVDLLSRDFAISFSGKDLMRIQKNLPPLTYLRVLALLQTYDKSEVNNKQYKIQMQLLLQSLPSDSATVLRKKWQHLLFDSIGKIELEIKTNKVLYKNNVILEGASFDLRCLQAFAVTSELPMDLFLEKIFNGEEANLFSIEKTRVAISRLNKKLEPILGTQKVLRYSKQKITLAEGVKINLIS